MKTMLYGWILCSLFFRIYAQSSFKIKGVVVDSGGKSIKDVSVFLINTKGKTISYDLTNENGSFLLSIPKVYPKLFIVFQKVGWKTRQDTLSKPYALPLKIVMEPLTEQLEEIVIKSSPIKQKGDTIIYDAQAYNRKENRVVQDILANMPGFRIDHNGKIFFQGEPIKKVMVEGLDMTNGDYTKITGRLSSDAIKKVELYQKYQEIKVLNNIRPSDDIALNLILKEKIYSVYHLETSGEMMEGRAGVKLNPMFFGKRKQWGVYCQGNHIQIPHRLITPAISMSHINRHFYPAHIPKQWIHTTSVNFLTQTKILNPLFNSKLYTADFNFLKLTTKKHQWKLGGDFFKLMYEREMLTKSKIYNPSADVLINRHTKSYTNIQPYSFFFDYTINNDKTYFKNKFKHETKSDVKDFYTMINRNLRAEKLFSQNQITSNHINWIERNQKLLWEIWQHSVLNTTKQDYVLNPIHLNTPFFQNQDEIKQNIFSQIKSFQQHLKIQSVTGKKQYLPEFSLGYEFLQFRFKSYIQKNKTLVDDVDWKNDFSSLTHHFFSRLFWYFKGPSWLSELSLPIHHHKIYLHEHLRNNNQKINYISFNPSIRFTKKMKRWEFSIRTLWENKPNPIPPYYPGKTIMGSYSVYQSTPIIQTEKKWKNVIKIHLTDPVNGFFSHLKFGFSRFEKNTMPSYHIQSSGFIIRTLINKKSISHIQLAELGLDKQFFSFPLNLSLSISYHYSQMPGISSGKTFIHHKKTVNPIVNVAYTKKTWKINLYWKYNFQINKYLNNKFNSKINQLGFNFNFYINKDWIAEYSSDFAYYFSNNTKAQWNPASIKFTYIFKKPFVVEISAINLFNSKSITLVNAGFWERTETTYFFRPFTLTVKAMYTF